MDEENRLGDGVSSESLWQTNRNSPSSRVNVNLVLAYSIFCLTGALSGTYVIATHPAP